MAHNFHILTLSVYPYLICFISLALTSSLVVFFNYGLLTVLLVLLCLFLVSFLWFNDIFFEALSGEHNFYVQDGFKFGVILFIFSEFMFFFSIFWLFFDSVLVPASDLGELWSPLGLSILNPFGVPLLNSFILLTSGVTVTWFHFRLLSNLESSFSLLFTVFLAFYFISIQLIEYCGTFFSFSDGVYGSVFFFSTGFHGLHVFFGGCFLFVNWVRLSFSNFTFVHHLGLEFSILYWHFVDVVWLFLFVFVYWWSF